MDTEEGEGEGNHPSHYDQNPIYEASFTAQWVSQRNMKDMWARAMVSIFQASLSAEPIRDHVEGDASSVPLLKQSPLEKSLLNCSTRH